MKSGLVVQCNANKGYDPLTETPDGRKITVPLGYERPQKGPTTNFVGNHMTQVWDVVVGFDAKCLWRLQTIRSMLSCVQGVHIPYRQHSLHK